MTTLMAPVADYDVQYVPIIDGNGNKSKGSSWLCTSLILANIILGVGLLNFPAAYSAAGGVTSALSVQMGCMAFIFLGFYLIVDCASLAEADTYQDTVHEFCGGTSLRICNIFIFLHNFGTCITFMVILADQLDQVMLYSLGPSFCLHWYSRRTFTLTVASLPILPLSFNSRMDSFKFISAIGMVSTLYVLLLVCWKFYVRTPDDVHIHTAPTHWIDALKVIPVICFSFEGHIEAVPLYACLARRTLSEFLKVCLLALLICGITYSLVGSLAYLTQGDAVTSDLLNSYYPPDVPVVIGTGIMAVKAIVTYPEILFCSRMVLDEALDTHWSSARRHPTARRVVSTILLYVTSLTIAHLVPSIGSVIAILGGSSALFVCVFPGLCSMQAYLHATSLADHVKKYLGMGMVVLGSFLAASTSIQAGMQLYTEGPRVIDLCIR